MAHDWKRCNALAAKLAVACRDFDLEPGTIATTDLQAAFSSVAEALRDIGVPAPAVAMAMRKIATGVEMIAEYEAEKESAAKRPQLRLVVDNDAEPVGEA